LPGRQGRRKHFSQAGGNNRFEGMGQVQRVANISLHLYNIIGSRIANNRQMMKNYVPINECIIKMKEMVSQTAQCRGARERKLFPP
jgi:hypothetical protein